MSTWEAYFKIEKIDNTNLIPDVSSGSSIMIVTSCFHSLSLFVKLAI